MSLSVSLRAIEEIAPEAVDRGAALVSMIVVRNDSPDSVDGVLVLAADGAPVGVAHRLPFSLTPYAQLSRSDLAVYGASTDSDPLVITAVVVVGDDIAGADAAAVRLRGPAETAQPVAAAGAERRLDRLRRSFRELRGRRPTEALDEPQRPQLDPVLLVQARSRAEAAAREWLDTERRTAEEQAIQHAAAQRAAAERADLAAAERERTATAQRGWDVVIAAVLRC